LQTQRDAEQFNKLAFQRISFISENIYSTFLYYYLSKKLEDDKAKLGLLGVRDVVWPEGIC
jgi:hypothetical protein